MTTESPIEDREWQKLFAYGGSRARALGLTEDDVSRLIAEYRRTTREKIAQGVGSLREGRGVDGPTFMARMDAELAECERPPRTE